MGDNMDAYLMNANNNTFILLENINKKEYYLKYIKDYLIDGLIIYQNNPLKMKIYNRDGTLASMCGNGIRCFIYYGYEKGYLGKGFNYVITDAGVIKTELVSTTPILIRVYFKIDETTLIKKEVFFIQGEIMFLYTLKIGTLSHVVFYKDGLDKEKVILKIKQILKNKVGNISFVKLNSSTEIEVLTFEKGVGYTASCGTGNAASFYVFNCLKLIKDEVDVINKGGVMKVKKVAKEIIIEGGATWQKLV